MEHWFDTFSFSLVIYKHGKVLRKWLVIAVWSCFTRKVWWSWSLYQFFWLKFVLFIAQRFLYCIPLQLIIRGFFECMKFRGFYQLLGRKGFLCLNFHLGQLFSVLKGISYPRCITLSVLRIFTTSNSFMAREFFLEVDGMRAHREFSAKILGWCWFLPFRW